VSCMSSEDKAPCKLDHNLECLVCDCWIENCAYDRYLAKDYKWETEEELKQMFEQNQNEE